MKCSLYCKVPISPSAINTELMPWCLTKAMMIPMDIVLAFECSQLSSSISHISSNLENVVYRLVSQANLYTGSAARLAPNLSLVHHISQLPYTFVSQLSIVFQLNLMRIKSVGIIQIQLASIQKDTCRLG